MDPSRAGTDAGGSGQPVQPDRQRLEAMGEVPDLGVVRALADLPECFRSTIYLADVEGYPYREVADILGIPVGTVMSRLRRGRLKLQRELAA